MFTRFVLFAGEVHRVLAKCNACLVIDYYGQVAVVSPLECHPADETVCCLD